MSITIAADVEINWWLNYSIDFIVKRESLLLGSLYSYNFEEFKLSHAIVIKISQSCF
jgi:hypothetical protein